MTRSSFGRRGRLLVASAFVLGALALTLDGATPSAAAGKKESHTKVTAKASKPDAEGRQTVTVTMEIEKPWHAYANPPRNEVVESVKTVVNISSRGGKLQDVKIEYPPGKEHKDAEAGNFWLYEGKVEITGRIRRARGDTGLLDVTVKFQNCTDKKCLMLETVKLTVE